MSTKPFRKSSPYIFYTPKHIEIMADPNYTGTNLKTFSVMDKDTVWSIAERNAKENPELPFLGAREYDMEKKAFGEYKFLNYGEVIELATYVAYGLAELGLKQGDACTECFVNRPEWVITDLALFRQGAVSSPLRGGLNNDYYKHNIMMTQPTLGVIAADRVDDFISICTNFKNESIPILYKALIVLPQPNGPLQGTETITEAQATAAAAIGLRLMKWEELIELGKTHPHDAVEPDPNSAHSIIFTSGTTSSRAKGVVIPHRGLVGVYCRHTQYERPTFYSYINMAHISERSLSTVAICNKGAIGFPSDTFATLMDDLEHLKPTLFCAAPAVLKKLQGRSLELIRSGLPEETVRTIFRKKFGGRCEYCVFFGASCTEELARWATDFLGLKFSSTYGLTETGGPIMVTAYSRKPSAFGCIGQPCPLVTLRIVDAPELGYSIKNDPPCGELLIRNPGNMIGYLNEPEKTAAMVDEELYIHSNDIVRLEDDGTLTIIDRRDNMIKTTGATFVPPEQIESVISTSQLLHQAWVYGRVTYNFIVSVVVPNLAAVTAHPRFPAELKGLAAEAVKNPSSEAAATICANAEVNKILLEDIARLEKENHFPFYWDIEGIIVEPMPWTEDNGLITFTNKLKRKALVEKYQVKLDELMEDLKDKVQFKYC